MTESYVVARMDKALSYVGPDATKYAAVKILRGAIKLHRDTGMIPTRGMTITRMLQSATTITGRLYKGKTKHDDAIYDLTKWIDAMRAALPVVEG